MADKERRDIRQEVTGRIIEAIEEGTAPWQCPHEGGPRQVPQNAVTGKPYTGGNHIWLSMVSPSADPRWCTYNQAKDQGWQVRKGERGTPIEVWKSYEKKDTVDMSSRSEKEQAALQKAGISDGQEITEQRRFAKIYTVFHASQIDGIPPLETDPAKTHAFDLHAVGEKLFDQNAGSAPILFDTPGAGFYRPSTDRIHLPPRDQFLDAGHLYATAAHEIAHSTMHPTRLNRERYVEWEQGTAADKTLRAREELRAEIASYILSEKTGIPHHPENHESYVAGWVSLLKDNKNEIYQAARDAEKIVDYVIEQQRLLDIAAPEKVTQQEVLPGVTLSGAAPRITVSPETVALADQIARAVRATQVAQQEVLPGTATHLNPADLIQFRTGTGEQKTGIVLREMDNRDSDKSVFFQYKEITPGKDGKPVIQQAGNSMGVIQKADISAQIPNAVPGIEKLDMQSKGFEKDAARIPGIKTALEYRVDSVMRQNHLTFVNKEPDMEKQIYHKVILTHRMDLKDRVLREPIDPDKPILEVHNHPRQEISGVLKDFSQSEFTVNTPEFGDVRVETHKRVFDGREEELRAAIGKPVDIAIDDTGKNLSLAVQQGDGVSIMQDCFQTPLRPVGLMPMRQMSAKDVQDVTGKLTHVHDTNLIELKTAKGPILVFAADPDRAHQAEIKKMVGHRVTVNPGEKLQVTDHTPEAKKEKALTR
ncbi:MAG: ArdC family protein [Acidithiobacillus sp.]